MWVVTNAFSSELIQILDKFKMVVINGGIVYIKLAGVVL